jgi:RNA polymerase sigma-70 factor (ECF subfamily)
MLNHAETSPAPLDGGTLKRTGAIRSVSHDARGAGRSIYLMTSAIAKGDDAAFNRFYETYFKRTHHYLLAVSGGREDAVNDALQDTMMRVIRYMKPFEDEGALWNWIRKLAKSAFIDQARKRKRSDAHASISTLQEMPAEEDGKDPDLELMRHLTSSLDLLETEERRLIEGKYLQGKSYDTLARELGMTQKAVESRLARIRKRLKAMIVERLSHEA